MSVPVFIGCSVAGAHTAVDVQDPAGDEGTFSRNRTASMMSPGSPIRRTGCGGEASTASADGHIARPGSDVGIGRGSDRAGDGDDGGAGLTTAPDHAFDHARADPPDAPVTSATLCC
ncbi:hypothetical protein [Microbispora bryophytorum]|uniref:Uncharacterized protein n=1 Tax=Microbispora bryophytorum subsp. camponoti TaxID=1677852 RepID=A0ABR8LEX4_9ACTN|nr:hypothetical protein [Microbispora camponoti]MBD3148384.1 hypothetical protein [Microbispora camponoti]